MGLNKLQQKRLLAALVAIMAVIYVYQRYTEAPPATRPLVYTRGMTVSSPVRRSEAQPGNPADALTVFLERHVERYPGVKRDLFRMDGDGSVRRIPVVSRSVPTVSLPTPTARLRSPEEIAAERARLDLSSFRFLGYLTDTEKDSSLFLSKGGELFIVKSGDKVMNNYVVKEAGKEYVVLRDPATKVEVRIDLTGGDGRMQ
jgi:hypothetical protein